MSSLNLVMLIGNLGREPEVRHLSDGRPVARFSLATTMKWKNQAGGLESRTEWHRVVAFGVLADTVRNYLTKGKQVFVEGRLTTRSYTNKSGSKMFTTEVILQRLLMLGRKAGGDAGLPPSSPAEAPTSDNLPDDPLFDS